MWNEYLVCVFGGGIWDFGDVLFGMCWYGEMNGDCFGEIDFLLVKEGNVCKWLIVGVSI